MIEAIDQMAEEAARIIRQKNRVILSLKYAVCILSFLLACAFYGIVVLL